MVQVLKSAQDFELFGGFKPWHRQGEHSKIQKPKRSWADAPFSTPHQPFLGLELNHFGAIDTLASGILL
jgi:hypothetical protein